MLKEFKEFAMKGNLIDLAVAFVMGAAFTKVTSAFIDGMIMPVVGMIQGKDLKDWKIRLKPATIVDGKETVAEVAIKYGTFITVTVEFLIVAFVMFLVIKTINKMKATEPAPAPAPVEPTTQEKLLMEIKELLKNK